MVLQCEWAQIQGIVLTNDGNGFGFGISGSRNSGAVVRNIFPGGAADRDGNLENGDHLLAVGDVRLWGMGAEQVASILRQAGQDSIRLIVARPVDPTAQSFAMNSAIVPTKVLTDPTELERILQSGLQAAAGQYQGNAASNGYSFDPSTGFGTEGYQGGNMEIIPPEAAHVMSLASVDPGSGSLMPVNSALPGSAPMLVVSPAIVGREDDEKSKGNPKTAEVPSESSSNIEKEIESDPASEQRLTDNVALPLRRPSVEISKQLITQECKLASIAAGEPRSSVPVETFVTTKNSSDDKPHHVILQKDGNKASSALAQSISPDGVSHTKTLIQVHTPSSSKTTSNTGSVVSECETNRSFQSNNPISGGQKVTLVTRQNDPDHVSIVLNPSSCSNTSPEIITTATAPTSSSNTSFAPSSLGGVDSTDKVDGGKVKKQENKSSIASSSTTVNHDTSSTASICTTTNSSTAGSRKIKKHGRKSAKENISISSTDEITGSVAVSKRSRKSSSKSPVLSKPIISSSAKDKDVIKSDSIQTNALPSESHCQRTQTGCNSNVKKVDASGVKSDNKQEVTFKETKMCKDELKLPLKDKITIERNSEDQNDRTLKDANRRVCSGDIELVPANVMNNSILPEKEEYKIELEKDEKGLGITVAGYICEKEDLCGIFVKSVIEDSMADRSGSILVNDQITEVDDIQLAGYTNQEAVEILKRTGKLVKLSIVRYLRGLKFEELQEGITQANVATPTSPYPQTPVTPQSSHDDLLLGAEECLNASSQIMISPSTNHDQSHFEQFPDDKSSNSLSKDIHQHQVNTHALSSVTKCPSSQSKPPLEMGSKEKVQLPSQDSSCNTQQLESSRGEAVVDSKYSSMRIDNNATKAHHDKAAAEQEHPTTNNQVLSQKSSTLSLINKTSASLDESSYNSVAPNSSSTKARHSVPNVLDSEGNSNTSTILPSSSNDKHNYSNNVSQIRNHNDITNEVLPLSGRTIISETSKQSLIKNTNLDNMPGASNNGIVQSSVTDTDKDDLQLKWEAVVGSKFKVVVAKLRKPDENSGLGIALEGTVEVEDGREVRPHHYIRDIQIGGPVGLNGILQRGDELLEVNGRNLAGLFHHDVVKCLKELPLDVCIVCARRTSGPSPLRGTIVNNVDPGKSKQAFASRKILSGSLQSLLASKETDLLLKAKSEVSLSCNTFSHSLSVSCSITNNASSVAIASDAKEKGEEFMFDKENKTLKNSASADQIAGNHSIINLSQDSKVLTSVPCSSILSTKTSNTSGISAVPSDENNPIITGSLSASGSIQKDISVPSDLYFKYAETNSRERNEETLKSIHASTLTEQSRRISKSLEPLNTTAMWEKSTEEVVLTKGEKGLGFSILDYQDPLNTSETVIVVRSVVPGGIAQVDGRLLPGDRIMFVNDTSLDTHTSLDCAVQALKGAPFGPVKIGISRPINFEEESNHSSDKIKDCNIKQKEKKIDTKDEQEVFATKNKQLSVSVSQGMISIKTSTTTSTSTSFCTTSATTERSERESASDTFAEGSNLSDWKTDYGTDCLDHDDSSTVDDKQTTSDQKLMILPHNTSPVSIAANVPPSDVLTDALLSPKSPSVLNKRGSLTTVLNVPILPHLPKYSLIIKKAHSDFLGIQLEALAYELCGTVIRQIEDTSVVAKDGRLRAGDLILYLNHECMWRVTCSQAKTILRRAELVSTGIPIVFVPEECLVDASDTTSQDEQSEAESLSESLKLSDINEDPKEKESNSSSNGSMSSEEIVPDLTVKSASSTNILTRFPSDLLETSVDPDNEAKGILSSDASNLPKTSNHSEIDIPLSSTIFESSDPSITGLDNKISDDKTIKRTKELNVMMEKEVSNKAIHISSSTLESLDSDSMQISVKKEPTMTIPNNEKTSSIPYTNDKTSLLNSNLETETPKVVSTELVSVQKSKLEETTKDSYQQSLEDGQNLEKKLHASSKSYENADSSILNDIGTIFQKTWGPERTVKIFRESPEAGLGISIVGGRVESINPSETPSKLNPSKAVDEIDGIISGIFIKSVIADSPAGRTNQLFTGDRLLQVDDVRLNTSDQLLAVQAIRNAGNPVKMKIRSLIQEQSNNISSPQSSQSSRANQTIPTKDANTTDSATNENTVDTISSSYTGKGVNHSHQLLENQSYPEAKRTNDSSPAVDYSIDSKLASNENKDISAKPVVITEKCNLEEDGVSEDDDRYKENSTIAVKEKDVSYLAFKAFDSSSISGTPSPRKHSSNNSSHSYGASGTFATATSICTLHEVTNKHVAEPSSSNNRDEDNSALISSYSDIRTFTNNNSNTLAPSFSIPTRNEILDHRLTNDYNKTTINDSQQSSGDENPFQNDRLPIWQTHQQFETKSYDNKIDSDTGSPSTTNSSAISLSYPPNNHNHSSSDLRNPSNITTTCSSTSPDYNQFDGYNYKQLNETPTSPELLAYRQQQEHFGTNCLQFHYQIPNNNITIPTIPNNHPPATSSADTSQTSGKELDTPEELKSRKHMKLIEEDSKENFYNYNSEDYNGDLLDIELERNEYGFGLALSGHQNRDVMGTFICGIHPKGSAAEEGSLQPGDEILKFHDTDVRGRSHLNVSAIIKKVPPDIRVQVVVLRHKTNKSNSAIKNYTHFIDRFDDVIFMSEEFSKFQTKREIKIKKTTEGLGVMIIEGSHKVLGKGIYISDIQKNSLASKAKLKVGDMLLAVNTESFLTINYDEAALILKQVTGNIRLLVVNPNDELDAQTRLTGFQPSKNDHNLDVIEKSSINSNFQTNEPNENKKEKEPTTGSLHPTSSSNSQVTTRQPAAQDYEEIVVELSRTPGKGLGLSVVGRRDGCGVFISDMVLGGSADVDGRILRGDQIMSVNGKDLSLAKQDEAVALLKVSQGNVKILVRRCKEEKKL